MKEKVVDYLILKIKNNNKTLNNTKLEEIKYGILGLYTLVTKLFVIFFIAILLNIVKEFLIFLIFYSILRSLGYGAHAKSNIMCWIFSTFLLIGLPYIFSIISISKTLKLILWFICFGCFIIFCPADTEKRPMINKLRKLKFKISLLVIDLIYLFFIYKYDSLANYIIAASLLQAFLSSPIGYIAMGQKVRFNLNDLKFS